MLVSSLVATGCFVDLGDDGPLICHFEFFVDLGFSSESCRESDAMDTLRPLLPIGDGCCICCKLLTDTSARSMLLVLLCGALFLAVFVDGCITIMFWYESDSC